MSAPALEMFPEIVVAGILFTLAVSPILFHSGLLARFAQLLPDWKVWIVVIVAIIYALGIAGNRLCEIAIKKAQLDPSEPATRAEMVLREQSPVARDWVERHKTYLKVERAAAVSSIVLSLCVLFYWLASRKNTFVQFLVAAFLAIFFSFAYWEEARQYKDRLGVYCQVIGKAAECALPK